MKLSDVKNDTEIAEQEFETFRTEEHITAVLHKIEKALMFYTDNYIKNISENENLNKLENKFGGGKKNNTADREKNIYEYFNTRFDEFSNEAEKYRKFFTSPSFKEESEFDTGGFKARLRKEIPVINGAMNSKAKVMQEYKAAFNRSNADDLYTVCYNIIEFAEDYALATNEEDYKNVKSWEDFKMNDLEDDNHRLESVIGNGIRATFLNTIFPQWFSGNYKHGIFALFFLTDKDVIDMQSQTSEFTMLKDLIEPGDRTIITEHNFFYPYPVYNFYMLQIYKYLEKKFKDINIELKKEFRFWYVNDFINFICEYHSEDIRTLLARDDKEINPHG
ncbi:MAG: hypothetical protein IPO37_02660 [Saprospiraceae bacterium]|nr:hypothetical protein [Saprospiraceae bacterium]MBP6739705.1 hypothetical protein [Leptospiraceae bacterium]